MNSDAHSEGDFLAEVVGCYYYHGVGGHYVGESLTLVREPRNPHDANAIAVRSLDGRMVGHLSRNTAAWFASELDRGIQASVVVTHVDCGTGSSTHGTSAHRPPRLRVRISRQILRPRAAPPWANAPLSQPATTSPTKPSGQPCFVVTAAFGSEDAPLVSSFRRWRDHTLSQVWGGRVLIRIYSVLGPCGARAVDRYRWLKRPARGILYVLYRLLLRKKI